MYICWLRKTISIKNMKRNLFTIIFLANVSLMFAQTNLTVSNVNSSDVTVNWDNGGCLNTNYQFRYKEASTSSWSSAPPTITIPNTAGSQSYILNGLNTSTTYNWRIKCGNGTWVNGPDFTTASCNITSSIYTTNASCSGLMDGSAILTINGGSSPYTFSWDNGATTQNLSGVLAGTYTVIYVDNVGCTDTLTATIGIDGATSIQQNISVFLPNPVTAYNQWSYDTLQMINTGCEVRARPEFEVSCSAGNIQQGDITIKWNIPGQPGGINIPYTINSNGNAEGFWSQVPGDSTGYLLPHSGNYTLLIKVKFSNPPGTAQYGTYTAYWETFEVDNLGNKIGSLSPQDTVSLSYIDPCAAFSNNITVSGENISCNGLSDGSAEVTVNSSGGGGGGNIFTGSYCSSGPTNNSYSTIDFVQLIGDSDSISNNTSGACDTYEDYTSISTDLTIGQSYNMRVDLGWCTQNFNWDDAAKIFIDWNIDGDFDDIDEEVHVIGSNLSPSTNNFSFTVPSTAISGNTRMRVISQNQSHNNPNTMAFGPCDSTVWFGATEDYSLVINASTISITYLWNNGDTTNINSGLNAGSYWCTVSDSNNCSTTTDTIIITEPAAITVSSSTTNVSCNGGNDGTAILTLNGGSGILTEYWGGNNPLNLAAGTYIYTVTDTSLCVDSGSVTITEPTILTSSISGTNLLCFNDNTGAINLTVNGGTSPYTFAWTGPGGPYNTEDLSGLAAGSYIVLVTDTNGCTTTETITITEPTTALSSIISPNHLTSCLITNGSVNLTVTGGTLPYTYLWNNNDTTEDIFNLPAGNYSVLITDSNGCNDTNSTTVNQPSNNLSLSLSSPSNNGYNIDCFGDSTGSIIASSTGGNGNITYSWSHGDTIQNISNLSSGPYSVTITDSIGCSLVDSITLNEPSELSSVYSTTNVLCNGDSTGSSTVIFSGGVTDYLLSWTTYIYPLPNGLNTFVTPVGVPAGVYPYSVMDINGCFHFDTITITEPSIISATATISDYNGYNISCNGENDGSIDLSIVGGTGNYTTTWTGANGYFNVAEDIYILSASDYDYTITDANQCVNSGSVTITEPTLIIATLSATNVSCNGGDNGTAILTLSGGTGTLIENWGGNNPMTLSSGTYTYIVTDSNLCIDSGSVTITEPSEITIITDSIIDVSVYNGNDGEIYTSSNGGVGNYTYNWSGPNAYSSNTDDISSLYYGYYIIIVTDSLNCSNSNTIFVDQPPSLNVSIDAIVNLLCFGECNGQINITANGGDSVYFYNWTGPNGFSSTDQDLDSLCAGTYELTLSDTTSSVYTTIVVDQPTQLQIITSADTALCYGGTAQASAFTYGGILPYTYLWDNNSSSTSANLSAGVHYINVTDFNLCSISDSVLIIQNDSMNISAKITDISCYGLTDGSIEINVDTGGGGVSPYSYDDNNGQSFQSSNIFSNLTAGISRYIIMDANGCTDSIMLRITEPDSLSVILNSTDIICYGDSNGSAWVDSVSGGTSPYTYLWSNGETTQNITGLTAGLVNIIVTDDNNCLATNSVIITELNNPVIVMITINGTTLEATPGFLSYQWIDENGNNILGATSQNYTPTTSGYYSVKVMDNNGCNGESEVKEFNIIIDAVEDISSHLNVYPNPTDSWITIESKVKIDSDINILNVFGEVVETIDYKLFNDNFEKINMSNFSKGIYLIQLINNQTIINHKIILQ